jgi:hypothetical protein
MKLLMESWKKFVNEKEEAAIPQQKKYTSNSFCKEYPDACKNVLGTQRANMPQVPDVGDFETDLESPPPKGIETNEPEKIPDLGQATRAYLDSSDDAGEWPVGDQVVMEEIPGVNPMDLTPTQKDTYMDNALKKVGAAEAGKWQPWAASVLVSKDNYLLDGHHRWAATIIYNDRHPDKQQTMTVQKVMMPIRQLLKVANAYTDAAGGARHSGGGTTME